MGRCNTRVRRWRHGDDSDSASNQNTTEDQEGSEKPDRYRHRRATRTKQTARGGAITGHDKDSETRRRCRRSRRREKTHIEGEAHETRGTTTATDAADASRRDGVTRASEPTVARATSNATNAMGDVTDDVDGSKNGKRDRERHRPRTR